MTANDELLIEEYLESRLTSDMKLEVEFRIQNDTDFRMEFMLRKEIRDAIRDEADHVELRKRITQIKDEFENEESR